MCRKMNFLGLVIVLVFLVVSTITLGVKAQTTETTLEFTVRQVVVEDGVASITGPAAGSRVELYDNLGKELISSGKTGTNGVVTFPLDEKYPLSAKGLFHTIIKVDGVSNGEITCQQSTTCKVALFSVKGLDSEGDDAILIVKVVRSSDLTTPVEGVQVNVWPADADNTILVIEKSWNGKWYSNGQPMIVEYNGVPCISNTDGYCAAYLATNYRWEENIEQTLVTNTAVKFVSTVFYDASYNRVVEGSISRIVVAVDQKDKMDDCVFKPLPLTGTINQSCLEKGKRTATAEALGPVDPVALASMNNAMVQASLFSKETMDLFAAHLPDQVKISELLKNEEAINFDPASQVKIILYVDKIIHGEYSAEISGPAVDKTVEITSPDDPDKLLSVCKVNNLGECVSIIDRSALLAPDGLLKFHVVADGFDNGIMICKAGSICEQHVYTVLGLTGYKDAILLYKVVRANDYSEPVQNVVITAGSESSQGYYRGCYTDENGVCPIYMAETGFYWKNDGEGDYAYSGAMVNWIDIYDADYPPIKDDRLVVYTIAVDKLGKAVDCTFASPLNYTGKSAVCKAEKKALQTAIAGYTATPTVTITPLPSATPTATEIPPTPTITLTPNPTSASGSSKGKPAFATIGVGVLVLVVLLGGGVWLMMRSRKQRKL